ncbi:uncharacterized protein LOC141627006 [Silene latifolia]|uniref:uncharacterized protein LOC141627006 n=1 Tax=Silene latifolia TaxID=37657 RepID=UPI003D777F63
MLNTSLMFKQENPPAAPYKNKSIEYWDDICTLCGPDRALGDGVEMPDEAAVAMDDELESEGGSSNKSMSSSKSEKQKRDKLADVVTSFTECFREYVQSKLKEKPKPTPQEIHDVVKNVEGIGRHQVMKATRKFTTGPLSDFEMLKSLRCWSALGLVIVVFSSLCCLFRANLMICRTMYL